jgi:hypothetical protein
MRYMGWGEIAFKGAIDKQSTEFLKATVETKRLCNGIFLLTHRKYPSSMKVKYKHWQQEKPPQNLRAFFSEISI